MEKETKNLQMTKKVLSRIQNSFETTKSRDFYLNSQSNQNISNLNQNTFPTQNNIKRKIDVIHTETPNTFIRHSDIHKNDAYNTQKNNQNFSLNYVINKNSYKENFKQTNKNEINSNKKQINGEISFLRVLKEDFSLESIFLINEI